jgi:hypothetical protein
MPQLEGLRVFDARGPLQLCELPTFRPFLALDAASESPVCFSPDSTFLLTRRSAGQFGL